MEIIVLCRIWCYEGLRLAMADMPITLYSGQTMLQIMTEFLLHLYVTVIWGPELLTTFLCEEKVAVDRTNASLKLIC